MLGILLLLAGCATWDYAYTPDQAAFTQQLITQAGYDQQQQRYGSYGSYSRYYFLFGSLPVASENRAREEPTRTRPVTDLMNNLRLYE
jgi:hypothetical protein